MQLACFPLKFKRSSGKNCLTWTSWSTVLRGIRSYKWLNDEILPPKKVSIDNPETVPFRQQICLVSGIICLINACINCLWLKQCWYRPKVFNILGLKWLLKIYTLMSCSEREWGRFRGGGRKGCYQNATVQPQIDRFTPGGGYIQEHIY